MRYGLNKQDGVEVRKTDDTFLFNSAFGYRKDTLSNGTTRLNLTLILSLQMGTPIPIPKINFKPFAPPTFLGLGAEYASKKRKMIIIPLTIYV
jgi:hypothetical protein